jgi:hypothetical protein
MISCLSVPDHRALDLATRREGQAKGIADPYDEARPSHRTGRTMDANLPRCQGLATLRGSVPLARPASAPWRRGGRGGVRPWRRRSTSVPDGTVATWLTSPSRGGEDSVSLHCPARQAGIQWVGPATAIQDEGPGRLSPVSGGHLTNRVYSIWHHGFLGPHAGPPFRCHSRAGHKAHYAPSSWPSTRPAMGHRASRDT